MSVTDLPDPLIDYASVFTALLPLNALLVLSGFIAAVSANRSPEAAFHTLLRAVLLVVLLTNFASVADHAQEGVDDLVTNVLHARPTDVAAKYLTTLQTATQEHSDPSTTFLGRLWKVPMLLFEGVLVAIVLFAALVAAIVFFLAYVLQKLLLEMGYPLAPLFPGFLMINAVRSIGVQYLLGMVGIILWPLGWAVASLVTDRLIVYATNQDFMTPSVTGAAFALRNLLASLMLAVWVIVSTIAAPLAIQRAVSHGVQIGTQLMGGSAALLRGRL